MEETWYNFGILYEACKQGDEAVVAYNKALEIEPTNAETRDRVAFLKSAEAHKSDGPSKLPMRNPKYTVPNNLVINRKGKLQKPPGQPPIGLASEPSHPNPLFLGMQPGGQMMHFGGPGAAAGAGGPPGATGGAGGASQFLAQQLG